MLNVLFESNSPDLMVNPIKSTTWNKPDERKLAGMEIQNKQFNNVQ